MSLISDQRTTRSLTIIAQDPGFRKKRSGAGEIITAKADLPAEELLPGPTGYRVKVIDYDVSTDTLYVPADPGSGSDCYDLPSSDQLLTDPRFHSQNVYAIVMRTLARFEKALGRRIEWGCAGHQLHVVPHAFAEPNAFYSRADRALFFGYFKGRDGNIIYTCLSHDVIAHETTHAILDGLRSRYFEPSTPDQAAFHEGFADIVAMLSVFSLPNIVEAMLDDATGRDEGGKGAAASAEDEWANTLISKEKLTAEWLKQNAVFGLAEEMGRDLSTVRGSALRRSVELDPKDVGGEEFLQEHRRGEILVAAMLNAFLHIWLKRIEQLGEISRGMVDRSLVVESGARVADHLLTMAIRAIDYCPPVDLSFSDYLSALLTVDKEVVPDDDRYGYRAMLLEQFGRYHIRPAYGADRDGTWRRYAGNLTYSRTHFDSLLRDKQEVFRFLWENRTALEVDKRGYVEVESVRPAVRVAPDGFMLRETVAEYVQILTLSAREFREMGVDVPERVGPERPIRIFGGATLIFDEYGQLKFQIVKHLANGAWDLERQSKRLHHLVERGLLEPPEDSSARLAGLHLARAGVEGGSHAAG